MTSRRNATARMWVAVLVAYVTAFQLILGGLQPLRAASNAFDPSEVLCTRAAAGHPDAPPPLHHDHAGDCCLAGCPMGAPLPAAPPAIAVRRCRVTPAPPSTCPTSTARDRRPPASPRSTRGPPRPV